MTLKINCVHLKGFILYTVSGNSLALQRTQNTNTLNLESDNKT